MALTACADDRRLVVQQTRCPPLVTYSSDFQGRAAQSLADSSPEVQKLVNDYGNLREACRLVGNRTK